jgi:cation transport regulator
MERAVPTTYQTVQDLPESVREHLLPPEALETYRVAYNAAATRYGVEGRARREGWGAVKRDYYRGQLGQWTLKTFSS